MASFNEFTIDKQEYMAVFKFFAPDNKDEVSIDQVQNFIQKFDSQMTLSTQGKGQIPGEHPQDKGSHVSGRSKKYSAITKGTSLIGGGISSGGGLGSQQSKIDHEQQEQNKTGVGTAQIGAHLTSSSEQKRDSGVAGGASTRQSRQLGLSNGGINTSNNANNYNRPTGLPLPSGQKPSIASTATKQPFGSAQKKGGFAGNSFGSGSTVQANGQMMNNGIQNQAQAGKPQERSNHVSSATGSDVQSKSATGVHNSKRDKQGRQLQNGNSGNMSDQLLSPATSGKHQQQNQQESIGAGLFPNGKQSLNFDEFIDVISESCSDTNVAENYLVYAFSMFDRERKGYISSQDLKQVFLLLNESVTDDEINTMIRIAGVKSNDKINFKEFVEFFYKVD